MKVYPRILEIADGETEDSFININNSSKNKILLFKIRRSDPKVVDFQPKRGSVKAGDTVRVYLKLHANTFNARILVQIMALKTPKFCNKFEDDWNGGCKRGVVKKVVYVQNNRAFLDTISIPSRECCEVKPIDDNCNHIILNTSQQSVLTVIKPELSLIKSPPKKFDDNNENYLNNTMNSSVISFRDYMSPIEIAESCIDDRDMTVITCLNSSKAMKKRENGHSRASQRPPHLIKSNSPHIEGCPHLSICTY